MGPTAIAPYIGGGGSATSPPTTRRRARTTPCRGGWPAREHLLRAGLRPRRAGRRLVRAVRAGPGGELPGLDADPSRRGVRRAARAAAPADHHRPGRERRAAGPVHRAGAAPDQLDATVDYTGASTLAAGTAWRWTRPAHRAVQPGRHRLAAQGLREEPGERPAVHRRTRHRRQRQRARHQHRRLPRGARVVVRGAGGDGAIARPGERGPAAGDILGHPQSGSADPPRPAARHRHRAGPDPVPLGAAGRPGPVDRPRRSRPPRRPGRWSSSPTTRAPRAATAAAPTRAPACCCPATRTTSSRRSPRPTRTRWWCSTPATRC